MATLTSDDFPDHPKSNETITLTNKLWIIYSDGESTDMVPVPLCREDTVLKLLRKAFPHR